MSNGIVRDLGRKAASDLVETVKRTVLLLDDPKERSGVLLHAMSALVGLTIAEFERIDPDASTENMVKQLTDYFNGLSASVLKSMKNNEARS